MSRAGSNVTLNKRILDLLFKWTGEKWVVILKDILHPICLKEQLRLEFMKSEAWNDVQSKFGSAQIADFLLKQS